MTLPASVTRTEPVSGYPVFEVDNAHASARIALHGAHVLEWAPKGQEAVLYLSPDAVYQEGKADRGGIPDCWPRFNKHATDPSKPAHGIARINFWEPGEIVETDAGTELNFSLKSSEESLTFWPHPFELSIQITVGMDLSVTLTTGNTGDAPFQLGQALHTYFAIGEIEQIQVEGLEGATYTDATQDWTRHVQTGPVEFHQEVNRIYYSSQAMLLKDPVLKRSVRVEKEGSGTSVVWNPWIAHAASMGDMPDDGYLNFVCLETTNAEDDVQEIAPGAEYQLSTRLSVEPM